MSDCFNIGEIDDSLLSAISLYPNMSFCCKNYILDPTDEKKQEIVKILMKIDEKQLKVKKNIVRMLNVIDGNEDTVEAEKQDNGYKLD